MTEPLRATIASVGARGDGVADGPDGPIYVPFTVPGDTVDLRVVERGRHGARGELVRLISGGPDRVEPVCRHFGACGGCALQHMAGDVYGRWVVERVRTALGHHGLGDVPVAEPAVSPPGSRRRVVLKALHAGRGVVLGFTERSSRRIVDLDHCPVARPALVDLLRPLRRLLATVLPSRAPATVALTETATGIDAVIAARMDLSVDARMALAAFAADQDLAALHWDGDGQPEPVAIRRQPVVPLGEVSVPLPPGAFVQATAEGEAALVAAVAEAVGHADAIADLFAGLGTFTFPLARTAKVLAVEGVKAAADALASAARAAGLSGVACQHRDLFRRPLPPDELNRYDAVVFDPPRAGARDQAAALAASAVPVAVAVSCNPNTFARDARLLVDGGYRLERVLPVDQFLWSGQVELVASFRRG